MKYLKENKFIILTIVILCGLMFYFINQKQGFHEDEIFSYGSSNYKYDNVYRWFGYAEANQDILYKQVLTGSLSNRINNLIKYKTNIEYFNKDEILSKEIPTWKYKEDALEYLAIQKGDVFNYFSVYQNQARDVHPPFFYYLVHLTSTLFYNNFTKYIIFSLNLIFFIGVLLIIKKIVEALNHKELVIPSMILYGASIGCISTVMFQRMYMMVTFFSILYLYFIIKFIKDDFKVKDKFWFILTIILGFLTQYYFCIYIVLIFIILSIYLLLNKKYKKWFDFLKLHVISALIGIVIYPFCIEDIFFSYRGIGSSEAKTKIFLESLQYYGNQLIDLFGLQNIIYLLIIGLIIAVIHKINKKEILKNKLNIIVIFLPIILFIMTISKIAPFLGENYTSRYMMLLFPVISIAILYILTFLFDNKKTIFIVGLSISLLLSINGLYNNTPVYLYKDYEKAMELAKDNSDKYFVYVFDNYFTHLSSLPEFNTYKASLILNKNIHDFEILNNKELNESNEFILCIKNWLNKDEILNLVLEKSGYKNYEVLLELNSDVESTYYKITK
ncbi:MAG TPA: glycosyltransferase family 39 protein [Candidatus Faecisoma merdavium]|nr:glycosyltransferase family 39 protein [Candidatus Faecisoma merdavium]